MSSSKDPMCDGPFFLSVAIAFAYVMLLLFGCDYVTSCHAQYFGLSAVEYMFNRYQTLLTGGIALGVGYAAVKAVHDQINFEANNREGTEKNKTERRAFAYHAALKNYLDRIDKVIRIVNAKFLKKRVYQVLNFELDQTTWDYLPKEIPPILLDWYYLS